MSRLLRRSLVAPLTIALSLTLTPVLSAHATAGMSSAPEPHRTSHHASMASSIRRLAPDLRGLITPLVAGRHAQWPPFPPSATPGIPVSCLWGCPIVAHPSPPRPSID